MKKNNGWLILLGIVGILALVWMSGKINENFTDPKCPNGGIFLGGNCYSKPSFGTPICPAGSTTGQNGQCQSLTCDSNSTDVGNGQCRTPIPGGYSTGSKPIVQPTSCQSGILNNGMCVMQCSSGAKMQYDVHMGPQCVYNPTASSSTTNSSTSSCNPSYQSVPGGSLETKCFNSL